MACSSKLEPSEKRIPNSHILRWDLQPARRCSLVRKSWSRNTLTDQRNVSNDLDNIKNPQSNVHYPQYVNQKNSVQAHNLPEMVKTKTEKRTNPRLCIRPIVPNLFKKEDELSLGFSGCCCCSGDSTTRRGIKLAKIKKMETRVSYTL